jgi:hypothetical protein
MIETLSSSQKHWVAVRSYLLHFFVQVHSVAATVTSHCKLFSYAEPKQFSWAKPAFFDFSWPNCTVRNHIRSTAADALILLAMRWQSVHKRTVQSQGRYHWIKVQSLLANLPNAGPKFSLWKTSLLGEGTSCTSKISTGLLCITID